MQSALKLFERCGEQVQRGAVAACLPDGDGRLDAALGIDAQAIAANRAALLDGLHAPRVRGAESAEPVHRSHKCNGLVDLWYPEKVTG